MLSKSTFAGAAALLAAPIVVIAGTLAQPTLSGDAATQVAALTDHRVIAMRHADDELVRVGEFSRGDDFLLGRLATCLGGLYVKTRGVLRRRHATSCVVATGKRRMAPGAPTGPDLRSP